MSATLPNASTDTSQELRTKSRWPRWLREPLLHFVLLGGLLFAIDHYFVVRADDPRTIVVGAEVDQEARRLFKSARGVEPSAQELAALRKVWLDNEVLYREGLAMQAYKGDPGVRERIIFKALSVIDANVALPPQDDKVLRGWFEKNRSKYDEPARFDFQEAAFGPEANEAALRPFADALNGGLPGDARAGLRVFKGRPQRNLVQSYGAEFAKALEESPSGEWRVLVTRDGPRVMRLEAITPAKPAIFEVLRGVVLHDWTDAVLAEQRSAAVSALAKKYRIRFEAAQP